MHDRSQYASFCFIHFTVNTFTGSEWGLGDEPESIFNPKELDARQWAKTAAEGGMKGLILTCKHHDGFCLWPSRYTEHSIKNSPYKNGKGDIVRETAEACKEYGLKFGVYLSPFLIIVEQISHHRHSVLRRQIGNLLFHAFLIQHLKLKMHCIMKNCHQQEERFFVFMETVRGVGGIDSWGSNVEDEYCISAEEDIDYSFTIC